MQQIQVIWKRTVSIEVTQLAQKDVYQSNTISDTTATMDSGTTTYYY